MQCILGIVLSHRAPLKTKLASWADECLEMLVLQSHLQLEEALQEVQHKEAGGLGGQPPEDVSAGAEGHAYPGGSLVYVSQVYDHPYPPQPC